MDGSTGPAAAGRARPRERRGARRWTVVFGAFLLAWIGAVAYLNAHFDPESGPDSLLAGWALMFTIVGAIPLLVVFAVWVRALLRLRASVRSDPRLDR